MRPAPSQSNFDEENATKHKRQVDWREYKKSKMREVKCACSNKVDDWID